MVETVEVRIARLGAQGDGVAETSTGPVYVARSLPGERVRADVTGDRGRLVDVIEPSGERATPSCPHFGACGGCAAQHMGEALYQRWKREMVVTAFAHRGLEPVVEAVVAVPAGRRRRATFAAERKGGRIVLGFHEEGTHTLVPISSCPVMLPAIEAALPALRELADVLIAGRDSKVRIAVTATADGLDVVLADGPGKIGPAAQARIAEIAAGARLIRVMSSGDLVMQSAVPKLEIGGAMVTLPPAAFIQATAEAEQAIGETITAATRKSRRIADLFCGLGTFTFGLARRAKVLAIDGDKAAIEALAVAAKAAPGVKPIETKVRDLMREPLSRTELADFDAVVLDPPRAGAKAQSEMLAKAKVPVVCIISCNPATLARDCRILVDAGYQIERIVPIDQFVWSPHIEAVAVLRRA